MNSKRILKLYREAYLAGDLYTLAKCENKILKSGQNLQEIWGLSAGEKVNTISGEKTSISNDELVNPNSLQLAGPNGLLKKAMKSSPIDLGTLLASIKKKYRLKDKLDQNMSFDFDLKGTGETTKIVGFKNLLGLIQKELPTLDPRNKNDIIRLNKLRTQLINAMPMEVAANVCYNTKLKDFKGRNIFTLYAGVIVEREKLLNKQKDTLNTEREELIKSRKEIEDKYKKLKISFDDIDGNDPNFKDPNQNDKGKGKGKDKKKDTRLRSFDVAMERLKQERNKIQKELNDLDKKITGVDSQIAKTDKGLEIIAKDLQQATLNGQISPAMNGAIRKVFANISKRRESAKAIKEKQKINRETITFDGSKPYEDPGLTTGQKVASGLLTATGAVAGGAMKAADALKRAPDAIGRRVAAAKKRVAPTIARATNLFKGVGPKIGQLAGKFKRSAPAQAPTKVGESYNRFSEAFFAAKDPFFTFINSQIKGFANLDINSFTKYLLSLVKEAEKNAAGASGWLGKILYGISAVVLKGITAITTLIAKAADYLLTVFSKPLFAEYPKFTVGKAVAIGAICAAVFWVLNKVYKKIRGNKVKESSYLYIEVQSTLAECNVIFDKMNKLVLSEAAFKDSAKKATNAVMSFIGARYKEAVNAFKMANRAQNAANDPGQVAMLVSAAGAALGGEAKREAETMQQNTTQKQESVRKSTSKKRFNESVKFYIKDMKKKKFNLTESEMKDIAVYIVKTKQLKNKQNKLCDYYGME